MCALCVYYKNISSLKVQFKTFIYILISHLISKLLHQTYHFVLFPIVLYNLFIIFPHKALKSHNKTGLNDTLLEKMDLQNMFYNTKDGSKVAISSNIREYFISFCYSPPYFILFLSSFSFILFEIIFKVSRCLEAYYCSL